MLSKICEFALALKGFDLIIWNWVQRERTKDRGIGDSSRSLGVGWFTYLITYKSVFEIIIGRNVYVTSYCDKF